MKTDKPPRQAIRTLIRKAVKNRYDASATIGTDDSVRAGCFHVSHVADWFTRRSDAGSVLLYHRGTLFFRFGPEA